MLNHRIQSGMSLLELLIVLSIAIVLTVMSVPLFSSLIQNYRLSTASEQLYNVMQYARTEAVKRNANVYVSFNPSDTWCYGVNVGSSCDCTVANNCGLGTYSYTTAQQLSLTTSGLTSNSIYFEGTHGAANASGSVTYTQFGSTPLVTVSIGRLGDMQMCSNTITSYPGC